MSELGRGEILSVNNLHRKNKNVVCVLVFRFPSEIRVKAVRERVCKDQNSTNNMRTTMKTKTTLLSAVLGLTTALAMGQAFIGNPTPVPTDSGVFAYWNFNNMPQVPGTGTGLPVSDPLIPENFQADFAGNGSATVSISSWSGLVQNFGGSTVNSFLNSVAGDSLSLQLGSSDPNGNQSFIDVIFSMANLQDLQISYWSRRTGTGFNSNQWSLSTDGQNFTNIGSVIDPSSDTAGGLLTLSTSLANNAPLVVLRYTLDGATTAAGNNRIDNLALTATVIPEPSTVALLGIASVILYGKLRRRKG